MQIIVGSTAANKWLPKFRSPKDTDIWASEVLPTSKGFDVSVVSPEILHAFEGKDVATLNDLLTIKLSHLPWDIFWNKHLNDYLFFKKQGAVINKLLYELLKVHWKEVHGNKPMLSLYRSKDAFFNDYVVKKYDHDYLHECVAYPSKPVYTRCLKDGQEVLIDKTKFLALPFEDQIRMFQEEVMVIALERWVLNPKCDYSTYRAYGLSLHKTVTSLTKGWASEFMCENIELFLQPNTRVMEQALRKIGEDNVNRIY